MPELADIKTCSGCMGCMNVCPKMAISRIVYADGHAGISVDENKCIECGACERVCPVVNGSRYGENTLKSGFYAGWGEDIEIRDKGATSGIFGELAKMMIESGGYVAGAIMDGLECKYILSDEPDDIALMQGSKYTSSDPKFIYKDVKEKLQSGKRVFFCGLPCHVAVLLQIIPERLKAGLLTADLICGGVSTPLLIKRYADANPDMRGIRSFRDKSEGWRPVGYRYNLKYIDNEGKIITTVNKGRNLITDGFACELTDRFSCYDCRYAFAHRNSDLTIGDLWGDKDFPDQHFRGVSSIIVHSEKGMNALREAKINLNEIEEEKVLRPNGRIYSGKSIKRYFPERVMLARGMRGLSYDSLKKIYASDIKPRDIIWLPFAAYRVISFKIAHLIKKKEEKKLLKKILSEKQLNEVV